MAEDSAHGVGLSGVSSSLVCSSSGMGVSAGSSPLSSASDGNSSLPRSPCSEIERTLSCISGGRGICTRSVCVSAQAVGKVSIWVAVDTVETTSSSSVWTDTDTRLCRHTASASSLVRWALLAARASSASCFLFCHAFSSL